MVLTNCSLNETLRSDAPSFSFEFFPPKDDAGEKQLWATISQLEPLQPAFVSVTYGAGGSTRERTVRITGRIAELTSLLPVGHLTVVGQSRHEVAQVLKQYGAAGVGHVLALRGDPHGGLGQPWEPHPDGLNHAVELVSMAREAGGFCVGVAAFPEGHPEAGGLEADARVLAAKAQAGAEFAVTQLFFRSDDYFALIERAHRLGCDIPVTPGVMPITSLAQVSRMAQLSGSRLPREVLEKLNAVGDDPVAVREVGIEIATSLCGELLAGGAPGLHFYTLNRSKATREIHTNLVG